MTTVSLDDEGAVIDGVLNVTHVPGALERFPDHRAQVGGFVLGPTGQLMYLRWVPGKGYLNTWDAAQQTLLFHVPERSRQFLCGAIDSSLREQLPINVMLLIGNNRYDVGTFTVAAYQHPRLTLVRRAKAAPSSSPPPSPVVAKGLPPLPPTAMPQDSALEGQYRRLLAAWGVDASYARQMFHLQPDAESTVWYTPDGILFDALSDATVAWCGPANRYGARCVLEVKPVFPAQNVFAKLRALARDFRIAALLLYGRPDMPATDERMRYESLAYSQGLMAILFRPGDGTTCRVHFNLVEGRGVRVVPGEVGEFGPLHASVLAGHASLGA